MNTDKIKDYVVLRDYDTDLGWNEIFFYDIELTNGDIDRIKRSIQRVKDEMPGEYTNEDIEEAIYSCQPYVNSIVISNSDSYHVVEY